MLWYAVYVCVGGVYVVMTSVELGSLISLFSSVLVMFFFLFVYMKFLMSLVSNFVSNTDRKLDDVLSELRLILEKLRHSVDRMNGD